MSRIVNEEENVAAIEKINYDFSESFSYDDE